MICNWWISIRFLCFCVSRFVACDLNCDQNPTLIFQIFFNLVPRAFPLKKWVGREKALASAGHVHSLNIPEKLIYMQPAGFALTEVERSNNGK